MDTVQSMIWSSPQAQYAGAALAAMVTVVAVGMMFAKSASPALKTAAIASFAIGILPSAFFSLLQINCLVNGEAGGRWWCSAYGWILSAIIIVMAVAVVASVAMGLAHGEAVPVTEGFSAPTAKDAKKRAEEVLASLMDKAEKDDAAEEPAKEAEKESFGDVTDEDEEDELEAADASEVEGTRERVTVEAFTI